QHVDGGCFVGVVVIGLRPEDLRPGRVETAESTAVEAGMGRERDLRRTVSLGHVTVRRRPLDVAVRAITGARRDLPAVRDANFVLDVPSERRALDVGAQA